ncbi:hypothetical protein LINPERPRIM_LOCUS4645 [Linum perenne]
MERSEPSLVPEWLRTTGNVSSVHHFASSPSSSSSSSHSDVLRSRASEFDSPRLDRSSSSNSRRSSSNGTGKHAYSSFSRNHRDRERDRDRDRLSYVDHWDRDPSDSLGSILTGRIEKDALRRSHSMVARKPSELLPRRAASDLRSHVNGSSGGQKAATFEKDFPSLGNEEREVVRVSSPGLSNAVQIVSVGSSGEGWTSALAEAPPSTGSAASTVQVVASSVTGVPSSVAGLNMAETLTQAPVRARSTAPLAVQTQRLEELAIKQSRQLIPVTPSLPKSSVLNASDKLKPKPVTRSGEMNMAAKNLQQQQPSSFHPANQKPEAQKSSLGKLCILKPGRENGVSHSPKDVASPTNSNNSRVVNTQSAPTSVVSASPRSPINSKIFSGERRPAVFSIEKKPSLSQTQSRNDFFNLLKKKTSSSAATTGGAPAADGEKSDFPSKKLVSDPESPSNNQNGGGVDLPEEVQRFSEEEAAFLRSLGWEETTGEEEGLTEEEINAFYKEYMKLKPSTKVNGELQQKLSSGYED